MTKVMYGSLTLIQASGLAKHVNFYSHLPLDFTVA